MGLDQVLAEHDLFRSSDGDGPEPKQIIVVLFLNFQKDFSMINHTVSYRDEKSVKGVVVVNSAFEKDITSVPPPLFLFYSGFSLCHCTMVCLGFVIMSCQCLVSDAPDPFLPAEGKKELNQICRQQET